jgi:phytoene dehydrogenase-like protein
MPKKVLIVGAGLGGLATGLRLAKKGYKVEIIEKNGQAGGRLNQIKKDGFTFDTGPSFFSMSYEFTEFARDCGISLPFSIIHSIRFIQ